MKRFIARNKNNIFYDDIWNAGYINGFLVADIPACLKNK